MADPPLKTYPSCVISKHSDRIATPTQFKTKIFLIYCWAVSSLYLKNMCIYNANINNKIEQFVPPFD